MACEFIIGCAQVTGKKKKFFLVGVHCNNIITSSYLGSMLLCTTSDNDLIIFCGHNNFVEISFFFSKDKIL
jgi:hypothetical protein